MSSLCASVLRLWSLHEGTRHQGRGTLASGGARRFAARSSLFIVLILAAVLPSADATTTANGTLTQLSGTNGCVGAASLGHIGNIPHPDTQAALKDAAQRLAKVGKASGILTGVEAEAKRYIEWGYNFVAVGTDTALLRAAGDNLVKTFKG